MCQISQNEWWHCIHTWCCLCSYLFNLKPDVWCEGVVGLQQNNKFDLLFSFLPIWFHRQSVTGTTSCSPGHSAWWTLNWSKLCTWNDLTKVIKRFNQQFNPVKLNDEFYQQNKFMSNSKAPHGKTVQANTIDVLNEN